MFNSPKMRKTMVVVMLLELLILLGLLVNDHIQAENQLRQQVHALATQVAALTQQQKTTAAELKTAQAQINTLRPEVGTLKQDVQTLKSEVQKLKTSCGAKSPCCKDKSKCKEQCKEKSKCKSDCSNSNCKRCPSKDKPSNGDQPTKKPECGNDKGTTSPPLHQVEMYYGAVKTVVSVPAR